MMFAQIYEDIICTSHAILRNYFYTFFINKNICNER